MKKNKKTMIFDDDVLEFIDLYSDKTGIQKLLVANEIMKKYMNHSQEQRIIDDLEKIKRSITYMDINSSLLKEALNTLLIINNIENVYTTEMIKSPALEEMEKAVEKKIMKNVREANKRG